jgi:alpha-tubulin suppressor-like RCC1 family protein
VAAASLAVFATCLATHAAQVVGWGWNRDGQIGFPPSLSDVVGLAGGFDYSLILLRNGTVLAYGSNQYGQTSVPSGLTTAVAVAAGVYHSLALRNDGTVVAWGENSGGQTNVPASLNNVVAVAAGGSHSLALKADGTVVAWGMNNVGQTDTPVGLSNVVAIAAFGDNNAAIQADGRVVAWGRMGTAQLPNFTNITTIAFPLGSPLLGLTFDGSVVGSAEPVPLSISNAVALAGNLVLTANGKVVAWGDNDYGQNNVPSGLSNVVAIASGSYHRLALIGSGSPRITSALVDRAVHYASTCALRVEAVGSGPLAFQWRKDGISLPHMTNNVLLLTNVLMSQAGEYSVVVSNALGTVTSRQMTLTVLPFGLDVASGHALVMPGGASTLAATVSGVGPFAYQWQFNGVDLVGATNAELTLSNFQESQRGTYTVKVTNEAGTLQKSSTLDITWVVGWGSNTYGESEPPSGLTNVMAVSAGIYHSLALLKSGVVVGWGVNTWGQKTPPAGLSEVEAIAAGGYHNLALKSNGTVVAWGYHASSQTNVPAGLVGVKAVAAGNYHSLALKEDGTLIAWGNNNYGQGAVPAGISNITAIAAGADHNVALTDRGTVLAWGRNDVGQASVPAVLSNVIAIAAGDSHNLAIRSDLTVVTWGSSGTRVMPYSDIKEVTAGFHSAALTVDGQIIMWGDNSAGQQNVPAVLPAVYKIAAGRTHMLALVDPKYLVSLPFLKEQPADLTAVEGRDATFSVVARGQQLAYQWRFNEEVLPGQTNASLHLENVQLSQQGGYSVIVSNSAGPVLSRTAVLTVELRPLPTILEQPVSASVPSGESVTFSVIASGGELQYQWQYNGHAVPGATDRQWLLESVQTSQQGAYSVIVCNSTGPTVSQEALLSVRPWPAPTIVEHPGTSDVWAGETITLRAATAGQASYEYQWRFGMADIAGATNATYVVQSIQNSQAGDYGVRIINNSGEGISEPIRIRVVPEDLVLREPDQDLLRAMLRLGGEVRLDFDGKMILASPLVVARDTVLEAYGRQVVLSGGQTSRVFQVEEDVTLCLHNLSVHDGRTNSGAGVYAPLGNLVCSNVNFVSNHAWGKDGEDGILGGAYATSGEPGFGGAVFCGGSMILVECQFTENSAVGGTGGVDPSYYAFSGSGANAQGGALYALGDVAITNCSFQGNYAQGGDGARGKGDVVVGGGATGGAIHSEGASIALHDCLVGGNYANSGLGPGRNWSAYRFAHGGGLCNSTGTLAMAGCTVISNSVFGEAAGAGIYHGTGTLRLSRTSLIGNRAHSTRHTGVYQSPGWPARGAGLYSGGTGSLEDCTISSNLAIGGEAESNTGASTSEWGGPGLGGGVCNSAVLALIRCSIFGNEAMGGAPAWWAEGASGFGGGVFNSDEVSLVNCTLAGNRASGHLGRDQGGNGLGGGFFSTNGAYAALTNCTLANNEAIGGYGSQTNGGSLGGNLCQFGELLLVNSIIAYGSTNNIYGSLTDLGHNISSDHSYVLTAEGSRNDTDPMLSALADNGGPTFTMALLPESPAIDAGTELQGIAVDQRGVARPVGGAFDIGAYEANGISPAEPFALEPLIFSTRGTEIRGSGPPNRTFRLRTSIDLVHWTDIRASAVTGDGAFTVVEPFDSTSAGRFYQIVAP